VADFIKSKGYSPELAKSGNDIVLQVPGFQTREEAQKALRELSNIEYKETLPFTGARLKEIIR
jgi:hypothetical protein